MTTLESEGRTRPHRPRMARGSWWLVGGFLLSVAGLAWFALARGEQVYASTGDSYPGSLTAVAEPVGYFIATLAGAVTFGGLLYTAVTSLPDARRVIDDTAFRTHLLVERTATTWAITAAAMTIVQASNDAGISVTEMVRSGAIAQAVFASELSRAWVAVVLASVVVAVTVRLSVRWLTHVVLLVPALVGIVAVPVSGNAGQGPDHDYATSAAIVFACALATLTGVKIAAAVSKPQVATARRVVTVEIVSGAITLGYGAMLAAVLLGPGNPLHTSYGRAAALAAILLLTLWAFDVAALTSRRRSTSSPVALPRAVGALITVALVALVTSMDTQPAPRFLTHEFTTWDIFLGYELPQPPSVVTVLTAWRFDTFIGAGAVVLAGAYLLGFVRLRRRGDDWPLGRLAAWLSGCLLLLFTSSSGVKAYGSAMFSVHMAEHMTLNMFVPVLLVMGGPVTLALRVLPTSAEGAPPGPREWLLWLIHSRVTAFVSHPVTAFVLFVGSLYAVYFTPIFDTLVRYHWGHELMSVHFLLVGYLFFWGIVGIDPGPRRLPFLGRLGLLFAVMPFHAFFGIATMTMTSTIGTQFYRSVDLPWLSSIASDQHLGGAIAWGSSELPVILVVVALISQWARQDRRAASRYDRHSESDYADDELEAYNAMLRELARTRR